MPAYISCPTAKVDTKSSTAIRNKRTLISFIRMKYNLSQAAISQPLTSSLSCYQIIVCNVSATAGG